MGGGWRATPAPSSFGGLSGPDLLVPTPPQYRPQRAPEATSAGARLETSADEIHCIFTVDCDPQLACGGAPQRRPPDQSAHTTIENPLIFIADRYSRREEGLIRCTGTASREQVSRWEERNARKCVSLLFVLSSLFSLLSSSFFSLPPSRPRRCLRRAGW